MTDEVLILLNGQNNGQPDGDIGLTIQFDQTIQSIFVSFDNDVLFSGQGYDYLFGLYQSNGYCEKVAVDIVYNCQSTSYQVGYGFILISECEFDRDKCQVKTKIFDDAFQTRINNNKSIPVYSNVETTKNGETIVNIPTIYDLLMIDPREPVETGYWFIKVITVDDYFRFLIEFISDGTIDYYSDYFTNDPLGSKLAVASGANLRTANYETSKPFESTFADFYLALFSKLNLAFGFERANGKPRIRIESVDYFRGNSPAFTLTDIPDIISKFDKDRLYSSIALGSDEYLEEWQGDGSTRLLSFPQIEFLGFKDETFGLIGECNIDKTFELTTKKVIFDTNIIEDIMVNFNQDYDTMPVIIQFKGELTDPALQADTIDILGIGTRQYNYSLTNNNQSLNHISGAPQSVWLFLDGYDPLDTVFEGNANFGTNNITFTNSPEIQYYSDPGRGNSYFPFSVQVTDAGNNYDPILSRYNAPAPGIYSFMVRIKKVAGASTPAGFNQRIIFKRMRSDGTTIVNHIQGLQVLAEGTSYCAIATDTFFCNAGDVVVVDIQIEVIFASSAVYNFRSTDVGICDGEPVEFSGNGQPLQGGELEPFDPTKYRAVIDTFKYPLGFSQIFSLINNTTQSIAYTDQEDPLSAKQGDILTIKIPALGKNMAEFTLKSNTI